MFKFKTTAGRVVNRFGLSIKADNDGIIVTDNKEIADIMKAMNFVEIKEAKEEKEDETEGKVVAKRGRKPNVKV